MAVTRVGLAVAALALAMPASAEVEPTPAPVIQRHAIPSGTPTPTPPPSPTPTLVPCDCDGDHTVGIDELVLAVRILLNGESAALCPGLDGDRDGALSVSELVVGVLHALYGCTTLVLPDGVFDANVFYGPAIIFFGPAAVHEDTGGTVHVAIAYGVGRSITASGRLALDGSMHLVGQRRDAGISRATSGNAILELLDTTYRLMGQLQDDELPNVGIRLVREAQGTPSTWSGDYDLTLARDTGAPSTLVLSIAVASSGVGRCEGQAAGGGMQTLRSGACLVSPFGGFLFATALLGGSSGAAEDIVLEGALETGSGGHGQWGRDDDGNVLGSWTATHRRD